MNDCKVSLLRILYYFGTNMISSPILIFMLIFFKTAEIGLVSFYFLT